MESQQNQQNGNDLISLFLMFVFFTSHLINFDTPKQQFVACCSIFSGARKMASLSSHIMIIKKKTRIKMTVAPSKTINRFCGETNVKWVFCEFLLRIGQNL